ncbi:EamA family transporter [Paenibacillus sp. TRM 82003]|nr:EamA family transporter [Paenibacillus sp. TRM 82003]
MNDSWIYGLLVAMTLCASAGAAFFKKYAVSRRFPLLAAGMLGYGASAPLNVFLLQKLPYTVVMPATALTFVWSLAFAKWWFREPVGWLKACGVLCICAGLVLLLQ